MLGFPKADSREGLQRVRDVSLGRYHRQGMSISMDIVERGGLWRGCMPASESSFQDLRKGAPAGLPGTYFILLRFSNGGEGDLGIEPGWFVPRPRAPAARAIAST